MASIGEFPPSTGCQARFPGHSNARAHPVDHLRIEQKRNRRVCAQSQVSYQGSPIRLKRFRLMG